MNADILLYLLCYYLLSIITLAFAVYYQWTNLKQQIKKRPSIMFTIDVVKQWYKESLSVQQMWKEYRPWLIFMAIILWLMLSPFLFPVSLISIFNKLIGYKSKRQKEAEEYEAKLEEAEKKAKAFMETEGEVESSRDLCADWEKFKHDKTNQHE